MEFTPVARAEDILEGRATRLEARGGPIALFRIEGEIYCIDDTCTHALASLSEGTVEGQIVTCPRHGGQFDVLTGKPMRLPVTRAVAVHPVKVEDGEVLVGFEDEDEEDYD